MRARTRPADGPRLRPAPRTVALTGAAVLLAAVAGPVAVARAIAADQPLTAGAVCAVVVLWCIAVGLAAGATEQARRLAAELAARQDELVDARDETVGAHARTAASTAAAEAARKERDTALAALAAAQDELARAEKEAETRRAERRDLLRLTDEILPAVVERLRTGASVDTALAEHRRHPQIAVLRTVAEQVGRGERERAAALAVCATAAGRVQALATSMHADLREMQHRHDEDVLGDLLRLDHSTAQAGRLADSIAVLTGARSGRRWTKPIGVESVLRGALGRIGAYQRVRLHNASTAAVAGYAAEGVMHALAELLDNAANFSAPPAEVHVYVEEAYAGLVITVEDGGLGLGDSWLRRAERAVSGEPLDLGALSAGTRIGLAVVGSLARKHGLTISFRPSARGGTGVVMLIPQQLITHPPATEPPPARPAPAPAPAPVPDLVTAPAPVPAPAVPGDTAGPGSGPGSGQAADGGLPQRRRGQTLAAATLSATTLPGGTPPAASAPPQTAAPDRTAPVQASLEGTAAVRAARFGAFRKALQGQDTPDDSPVLPKDDS
ncbi:ATP-binding protein [Kitasatospora herbaricolor]|uniref:histidine kinase n=1 Tax=Kitasatospora herbaricolor TaxID=68217 RepID=A0ABZ1W716_9ACTN|nr:ATP-binding protein [Kitasatospora herbaricolor]